MTSILAIDGRIELEIEQRGNVFHAEFFDTWAAGYAGGTKPFHVTSWTKARRDCVTRQRFEKAVETARNIFYRTDNQTTEA